MLNRCLIIVVVTTLLALIAGCGKSQPAQTPTAPPTATETPIPATDTPVSAEASAPPKATPTTGPSTATPPPLPSAPSQATISPDTIDQIVQRQALKGHTDLVYDLAFTPDARFLASGSVDGTVRLWDVTSGQAIHILQHSGGVCRLAMSPDGGLLASGGLDRSVKLWDLETEQVVHTFSGYEGAVCGLGFSPDGALLATGSADQSVKLWNVASGQLRHTLSGHTSAVFSVAFAPNGTWLASGSARPELHIKLWDVESGQEVRTLAGQETDVHDLAFSPDGSLLAAVGPMAEVKLWSVASGQAAQDLQGHDGNVFGTAFSMDGSLLASSGDDGTVRLWDVATGRALRDLRSGGEGLAVAFSPDGSLLAYTGADNQVYLWGIPPHTPSLPSIQTPPTVTPMPPTPTPHPQPTINTDGRILFIGNSHTFMNDLPRMFAELARSGGREVSVDSSAVGGYTLERHVGDPNTQEKLDRADWDFVVLQESTLIFTEESTRNAQMAPAVRALEEKIRSQGAQTILTLMWASTEAVDEEGLAHFASEQAQATAALQQLVQGLDILVAPVGPAWEKSLRQRPELKLWGSDNHHASPAGTYLMACVLYATIYQQSPVGLSFTAGLPEEVALFLQEIAEGVAELNMGTSILSGSHGALEVWVTALDGSEPILVSEAISDEMLGFPWPYLTWSPDGTQIAFHAATRVAGKECAWPSSTGRRTAATSPSAPFPSSGKRSSPRTSSPWRRVNRSNSSRTKGTSTAPTGRLTATACCSPRRTPTGRDNGPTQPCGVMMPRPVH